MNNKTRGARFLCSLLEKPALAHVVVALAPGAMVGGKHEDMRPWSPEEDALLLDIVKVSDKRSSLTYSHPFALLNPLAPFALADGGQAVEDHRAEQLSDAPTTHVLPRWFETATCASSDYMY